MAGAAQLVVFPENALFLRIQSGSKVEGVDLLGPEAKHLQKVVELHRISMLLTTPVLDREGKLKNSTVLFDPIVGTQVVYSKIHMFDVDVQGAPPIRESDHFEAGDRQAVIEILGWKFGLSICYDLRFSELYLKYAQNVDVILVPSAFLVPTGEAHWHTLLRARAIESQCFVVAPAQSGSHVSETGQSRSTYGHSLVVDPWGRVLDENLSAPSVHVIELRPELMWKTRQQIPMAAHRKLPRG